MEARETCVGPRGREALGSAERYRGPSLIRNRPTLGPYLWPMPRVLGWSEGGRCSVMSELTLQRVRVEQLEWTHDGIYYKSLLNKPDSAVPNPGRIAARET